MIVPNSIDSNSSGGEKAVFRHFSNDVNSNSFIILHSLFVAKHLTRISGELDFLVLAPGLGIFALEVKHGRVERESGIWKFTDRNNKVATSTIGPFRQVNDTMHSLRNYLFDLTKDHPKLQSKINKYMFGCGVMFTGLDEFYDYGTEAEPWQIFTRSGFRAPASHYISALSNGFHEKYKSKHWYDVNSSRPTKEDCDTLYKLLRGDFHYNYSNLNQILDEENVIAHFTEEQFELLSFLGYNDRGLIQGGAGTGKTLMATEWFQRNSSDNFKIGFFCFNKKLGQRLNAEITQCINIENAGSFIGNLHSYMISQTKLTPPSIDQSQFYNTDLPLQCLIENESLSEQDKFDMLIIDEAQDLMSESYIDVFDSMLKGGIAKGKWVMFGDFCNQLIYQINPEDIINQVSSVSAFTRIPPLKINCRNSKNIVLYNHTTTGCEKQLSPEGMIQGEHVEHFFPAKSKVAFKVDEIIKQLLNKKVPHSKITVLTKKSIEKSELLTSKEAQSWKKEGLEFSTIHSYKGLENSFVIVSEFDELESDYATSLLYIGISRAKLKLFLVLDSELEKSYNQLLATRIKNFQV